MKHTFKLKAIYKIAGIIALVAVIGFSFAACDDGSTGGGGGGSGGGGGGGGGSSPHTHTYSSTWSSNATQHWRECTAGDGAETGRANHTGNPCNVCGYSSGGGGNQTFTSIADFQTWLKSQSNNTVTNPYNVRINVNNIKGSPSLLGVLNDNRGKYVNIDLSGSTFTSIPDDAFLSVTGCPSLTGVIIGNNVTSIGRYAFRNCSNLNSVTIGNNVTSIGLSAFNGCTSLPSVTIPARVTSIDGWAFNDCDRLTRVTFQGSAVNFPNYLNAFPGDLQTKYLAAGGGPGTYNRSGSTWTKQ